MAEEQNMPFGYKMLFAFTILCFAFGAYEGVNSLFGGNNENNDDSGRWQPDKKELFCDKEFEHVTNLENIAMKVKRVTILKTDGTYESRQGWSTDEAHEQDYRTTVGRSSDDEYAFTGTWQIIKSTESLRNDGSLDKSKPTYIKFNSSTGQTGYACITCIDGFMALQPIDANGEWIVDEGEIRIGMFAGSFFTSLENAK